MDDSLLPTSAGGLEDEEDTIEEDVPDWSQLAKLTSNYKTDSDGVTSVPFIPKRGEKDFAPLEATQSKQAHALQESRNAMYAALKAGQARQHSSRSYNKAVWHPQLSRASMDVQGTHGIHFQTMGRYEASRQRIELLPEETLFLVERGGLECWTEEGVPMSAQHVWMAAFTSGILSCEQYQVYAYLRRLGYSVHRASMGWRPDAPPTFTWWQRLIKVLGAAVQQITTLPSRFITSLKTRLPYRTTFVDGLVRRVLPIGKPVSQSLLSGLRWSSYAKAFSALRIIPSGPATLPDHRKARLPDDYKVFWHVYKPNNRYKKTSLPPPDFSIVVLDGSQINIPTMDQISLMLDTMAVPPPSLPQRPSFFTIIRLRLQGLFNQAQKKPKRRGNIYGILKSPQKAVVLAVIDNGTSYFVRYTRPSFASNPWV